MDGREVVITGMGILSPLGKNAEENRDCVRTGKTGIGHYPAQGLPDFFHYMGKVSGYDLPPDIPPKQMGQMKFLNRGATLGFCAAYEALSPLKPDIAAIPPGRRALYVAAGDFTKVGYDFMYPALRDSVDEHWETVDQAKLNTAVLNKVNPFYLLESLNNNLFSFLSAVTEFMGPNTSLATLSPCGSNALELACRSIAQDKADVALAAGYGNWITGIPLYELEGLGILSRCRNGAASYRPFDRNRDGFITGEGGAAMLLESEANAQRRGTQILGRVRGFGNCVEFPSTNHPGVHETVIKRNILLALKDAGRNMSDLAFIIPHGSGTRKGDRAELRSISELCREYKSDTPLCGLKPYTGHIGAASDIMEVICGVYAIMDKTVPATLNFEEPDQEFSHLNISGSNQRCTGDTFLSVSYGVGGQSSSVIVEVN